MNLVPARFFICSTAAPAVAVVLSWGFSPGSALSDDAHEPVDFDHDVVPVLREHCVECHGGEEAKGGFSLNDRSFFLEDEAAVPGQPEESLFLQLITDDDPDYQMPPEKKERVPAEKIAVLKRWVEAGMPWTEGFSFGVKAYEPPLEPRRPELPAVTGGRTHPVDRFLDAYWSERGIERPAPADDAAFLRRAALDLVGLLPSAETARAFAADKRPGKREQLVEDLLADDVAYTEHWLTFWNDLLRNDYAGTGFITGGRTQISSWLYEALRENRPFDRFATELIAPPTPASAGFINGIKWRGEVSAGQSTEIQFAQSLTQSFLGINMKCASCHDSFIDRWKLSDAYALAAVYAESPLEIHRCDKPTGEIARAAWIFPELGEIDPEAAKQERLDQLADLMTHPENGRFARTLVNRLWAQLMGRGLVHPLDAMHAEPWSADLLDFLASDFQENGYDLKHTLRLIATSDAYRARSEIVAEGGDPGEDYVFRGPRPKRLTAEQFADALWQLSGTAPEKADAPVIRGQPSPEEVERFTFTPQWIWGATGAGPESAADTGGAGSGRRSSGEAAPPPAGEELLFRKTFKVREGVRSAGLVVAGDNRATVYLNRKAPLTAPSWDRPQHRPVNQNLREGKANTLLAVARNGGTTPNPAGFFAALRIVYEDGSEEIVATGSDWEVSREVPAGEINRWKWNELEWEPAVTVTATAWENRANPRIPAALVAATHLSDRMVRASLVKSTRLMRSLGRPNRDQIVTSRPSELTTLEALELSNSQVFADHLAAAAERFDGAGACEEIYLSTLCRPPGPEEKQLLEENFGPTPDSTQKSDLLWSLMMSPEFFFVR